MKVSNMIGDRYSTDKFGLYNRTGAATVKGGVYFVDSSRSEAESTDVPTALGNVTAVTTALMATSTTLIVADGIYADNAPGIFGESYDGGVFDILVDGTTDVAAGDFLKPVNAATYMVKAAAGETYWAKALEARTTNSAALVKCRLYSQGLLSHT